MKPEPEDFRGTIALMQAANNVISFHRDVENDSRQPCVIYHSYRTKEGEYKMDEVGKAFIGNIEDLGLFQE